MDSEHRAKRQSRMVIASEILMVVTVAITVLILAFVVSGYWLNSDFKVERQGLLQVSSYPTGADLLIDGEGAWLQRTNASKVLPVGEHTLTLTKDGYDTWSKTIEMREGLLYRIAYPRLFLKERESAKAWTLPADTKFVSVSPNQKTLLVVSETAGWQTLNLEDEKLTAKTLKVDLPGEIKSGDWAEDSERILLQLKNAEKREWVLLNTKNTAISVNLTTEFATDFSRIEILDNSASNLLAVVDGDLRRVDVPGRSLSSVLVPKISAFDHRGETVVYSAEGSLTPMPTTLMGAEESAEKKPQFYVGILNLADGRTESLVEGFSSAPQVLISRFYDDDYLSIIEAGATEVNDEMAMLKIYKKDGFTSFYEEEVNFLPKTSRIVYNGEFVFMNAGANIATFDMEAVKLTHFALENPVFGWISRGMLYNVSDGHELIVYDPDGLNRRVLASGVNADLPVTITREKWLYYFDLDGNLVREEIAK